MMEAPKTHVPPCGNPFSPIIIVGEQPGRTEVAKRIPFCGKSGEELTRLLALAGISRSEVILTNVIKDFDHKLDYYLKPPKSKTPAKFINEGVGYANQVVEEVSSYPGSTIIAVGNCALFALTGRWGIENWRGSVLDFNGKKLIPTIHPATIFPPKNQPLNRDLIRADILRAAQVHRGEFKPEEYDLKIAPSFQEAESFIDKIRPYAKNCSFSYDIETAGKGHNQQVTCISFSYVDLNNKLRAISIPFIHFDGGYKNYFLPNQELVLWAKIKNLLEDPLTIKTGQNLVFDSHFLLRSHGIITRNMQDTMIAQQILMGDYPRGLDFITRTWTNQNYYKADGKKFITEGTGTYQKFWAYNGLDSVVVELSLPKMKANIKQQRNEQIFSEQCRIIPPLAYMMEHGIKVDLKRFNEASAQMKVEIDRDKRELTEIIRSKFNGVLPNWYSEKFSGSGKQIIQYCRDLGYPTYKNREGGLSTDDDALKRLIRPPHNLTEFKLVQKIRENTKLSSTYLNLEKVDPDGRIRCSYNPAGTKFSRLSSSESIFGTGTNLQNWKHSLMSYLTPDEGYCFFSFDLSQAENRIVAYVAGCIEMMQAFETGICVHSLTAQKLLKILYDIDKSLEEIKQEDSNEVKSPLGGGDKTWRSWGKKTNHSLNYKEGIRTFALQSEVDEKTAKLLMDVYYKGYPEVPGQYWTYIQNCLYNGRTIPNLMGRNRYFFGPLDEDMFRKGYAYLPQGTVGDLINQRGLNYIYYNQNQFRETELMLQVHDSIGFQLPLSMGWNRIAETLLSIRKSLETPLKTHKGLTFNIPADLTVGKNLNKREGFELKGKKFSWEPEQLARDLKVRYEKL